jgi:cell division protease FtsH
MLLLSFITFGIVIALKKNSFKKTTFIKMTNINDVVSQKYFVHQSTYDSLIKNIENHKISKIYFTKDSSNVISLYNNNDDIEKDNIVSLRSNNQATDSIYSFDTNTNDYTTLGDYGITPINPIVIDDIATVSIKNNVETIFLKDPYPNFIQTQITNILDFTSSYIYPFFLFSFLFSVILNIFNRRNVSEMNSGQFQQGPFQQNPFQQNPFQQNPFQQNGKFNKDLSNLKKYNISLSSFAGSPEILEECFEVVSYLKNNTLYKSVGAEIPRGILLEGPPGTGKTLLAKAIASEANANFISVSASEFIEVFVGVGALKVRNLFKTARENNPCIIFIDEIDAIGKQRSTGALSNNGNDERDQTLNQLLAEMDGFASNENILIMAATNRKDILDKALTRPGRFDRIITVPFPDKKSRIEILKVHSNNKKFDSNINFDFIADLTNGFSGAQIKNLLNEAAIFAARTGSEIINQENILNALDKLVVGLIKKIDTRPEDTKRRVAIHETGHAYLAKYFDNYFDLKKVSIQSTYSGAGGFTIFQEWNNITDGGLYTKDMLFKRLIVTMGGKAAENIYYGTDYVSLGAIQDLKQANSLAQKMIENYGMGEKLETFFNDKDSYDFYGLSDDTKYLINNETSSLVKKAYEKAKDILVENNNDVNKIVEKLLKNTTLYDFDFF